MNEAQRIYNAHMDEFPGHEKRLWILIVAAHNLALENAAKLVGNLDLNASDPGKAIRTLKVNLGDRPC